MAVDLQRLRHMLLTTGGGHHQLANRPGASAAAMPASEPGYGAAALFTPTSAADHYSERLALAAVDPARKGDGAQEMTAGNKRRRVDERSSVLGDVLAAHAQQQTVAVDHILHRHVSPVIKLIASFPAFFFYSFCLLLTVVDGAGEKDVGCSGGAEAEPPEAHRVHRGGQGGEAAQGQGRRDRAGQGHELGAGGAPQEPLHGGSDVARRRAVPRGRGQRAPRRPAAGARRAGGPWRRRRRWSGRRRVVLLGGEPGAPLRGGGGHAGPDRSRKVQGVRRRRGRGAAAAVPAPLRVRAVRGRSAGVPVVRMRQERQRLRQLFVMQED
uniref:Uncharacterized protein n=1 Tax=Aegilops tauschii subsp. strangulata TaxID=200361 RepID=A0A453GFN6_AEGTS